METMAPGEQILRYLPGQIDEFVNDARETLFWGDGEIVISGSCVSGRSAQKIILVTLRNPDKVIATYSQICGSSECSFRQRNKSRSPCTSISDRVKSIVEEIQGTNRAIWYSCSGEQRYSIRQR